MPAPTPPRLLVLFQGAWEDEALQRRKNDGSLVLEREGFEILSLRHAHRLVHFDAVRYAELLAARYRGRVDGVWSNDDSFGCLLAAVVAQRLGLPGNPPTAIVRAQHKVLLREALAAAAPAATVAATPLPFAFGDRRARDPRAIEAAVHGAGRTFPLFCKPVKGVFSGLARRVADANELAQHHRLSFVDRLMLRGSTRPWQQLAGAALPLPCSVDRLILEEPMRGVQVNVDGYAESGALHVLGVVDEWMYGDEVAGARHFAGFTYPSRLASDVLSRVRATATAAVRAVGITQGLWNVELFVQPDGAVRVIEINPRSAGQFATLYLDVDGVDVEGLAIALALGQAASSVPRAAPVAGAAASFVFRRFDGTTGPVPDAASLAWLAHTHPRARMWLEHTKGRTLRREYRWFGSHRYAVLNHGAADFAALQRDGADCARRLFGAGALPLP